MINSVDLSELPCFDESESFSGLAKVNYVFGPNGSGKTTISQYLATVDDGDANIDWEPDPQTVKVYNRDYARQAFTNVDGEERGVFLLGENSGEIFEKIRELEELHVKATGKITTFQNSAIETDDELDVKRSNLAKTVWERRSVIPNEIKREMAGLNGSVKGCLDITLEKARQIPARGKDDFETLRSRAEIVFDKTLSEQGRVPQAPAVTWDEAALRVALSAPIVGSSDVPLAEIIERLDISDWVREGMDHLHAQENRLEICPFCQQKVTSNLGEQLANIFDETYHEKRVEIEVFQRCVKESLEALAFYKEANAKELANQVGQAEVERAFGAVELHTEEILAAIDRKLLKPSEEVEASTVEEFYTALNSVVDNANRIIDGINEMIRDRKKQRPLIIDAAWCEFIRGHLDDLVTVFLDEETKATAKVAGLRGRIAQQESLLRDYDTELRRLRAQVTSSEGTIQSINDMLEMSHFHSFKLDKAQKKSDGYRIIRENGDLADVSTLSEGERTFVTFLYYYHSLSEVKQDGETEGICAVIDDPISSLDGDIMFVVSSLLRNLIGDVRNNVHARVSQVILLTHNTRFHNEVSYAHKGKPSPEVKFYRLRKFSPAPSRIEDCGQNNPIRSVYQELWDEVATARARPNSPMPWLPNVLRRILESYFSTLGGKDNLYVLGEDLNATERALHEALVAWSHRGSHTIVDADVYAQSSTSNAHWLSAFERIFVRSAGGAHIGHYEMMMGEAREHAVRQ